MQEFGPLRPTLSFEPFERGTGAPIDDISIFETFECLTLIISLGICTTIGQ
jgi:hypothetical protein